jgi:multiple sugar transport system ATP-binding protein
MSTQTLAQGGEPKALSIHSLSKQFGAVTALDNISFSAEPGEVIAICGPSGAGKSTLARLLSGLEDPDQGVIKLGERVLSELPPQKRRVAHMFESLALYPTLSVFANVASALRAPTHRGLFNDEQIKARVEEMLELTDIAHLAARRPSELSGGQRQRVALCRTLVQTPDLFILDEPIGHLDAKLRHRLRGEISRRQRALGQVTLWLTPDTLEGMAVADRVIMLVDGRIQQIDTAHQVYSAPASTSVARLVGDPAMNLLDVWIKQTSSGLQGVCGGERMNLPDALLAQLNALGQPHCTLGFPPLHTALADSQTPGSVAGEIYTVEPFGKYTLVTVDIHGTHVKAKLVPGFKIDVGTRVHIRIPLEHALLFEHESGRFISKATC